MAKLKDHIIKQEEHSRIALKEIQRKMKERHEATLRYNSSKHQPEEFLLNAKVKLNAWRSPTATQRLNNMKHQWTEDMPDLEGKALADAEKQFDYDSWLGEHGIGE